MSLVACRPVEFHIVCQFEEAGPDGDPDCLRLALVTLSSSEVAVVKERI